ncbi:DUF4870 domain-containing protein [Isoptericola dokdonensis]|jgi:uncharacterized Tic20 family protein|uniref:DUF4870 domain-containing protein n=1 Tax=Isoptericola dokdonensis DS-3 TaxID=1300344 RepID=A0A161IEL7_9MICO|nr:DUF4870 domain-containing protein [Isoptericola dokdonensis]ANC29824.1 hypothetical protein I598_0233 [Isoptericola dokdonensis DS-3]
MTQSSPAPAPAPRPLSRSDERMWAIFAHVGPLIVAALSVGLLGVLAPLVIWIALRDRSAYVADQAKEALNFQIGVLVASAVGLVLRNVLGDIPLIGWLFAAVGSVLLAVVWIAALVLAILAAVAVNRHELYRYPFTLRLVH